MAYRIDPTRSTAVELRRALSEQLDGAARELRAVGGTDATGIHQARKHLKKARSLLRLARADLGKHVVHEAQDELRSVAAVLAGARDADALVETAHHLADRADRTGDGESRAAVGRVRAVLAHRAEATRSSGTSSPAAVATAARTIDATSAWLQRVRPASEGWAAVEPGLHRSYQGGRAAFGHLPEEPTVDELHEWRKRVKDLWYHLRLLRSLWPEAIKPQVAAASDLADLLGTDHDLGLLTGLLTGEEAAMPSAEPPSSEARPDVPLSAELDEGDVELLLGLIARERTRLQAEARRLGSLLYADPPDAWSARLGIWWSIALTEDLADPSPDGGAP
jgi:CHAD domain-containing protein